MLPSHSSKPCRLPELAACIDYGASIGIDGVFLHRSSFAPMQELASLNPAGAFVSKVAM